MNQTVPITLSWGPVGLPVEALNINQLGTLIAAQLAGAIRADVSFYLEVLFDPTSFITNLIFNSTQRVWKAWDQTSGSYVPLTSFQLGDVKSTFVAGDQLAVGWVILDGRAISAIPGATTAQLAVLTTFFPGGILPALTPANVNALPQQVLPEDGFIEGLPFSGVYDSSEVIALRDATEVLRDSDAAVLAALRTPTSPPLYASIFVGYA